MFSAANALASTYTFPVIISYRRFSGNCDAIIGSFVVINDEGYYVTAYHIIKALQDVIGSYQEYNQIIENRRSIEKDSTLSPKEKNKLLAKNTVAKDAITDFFVWWGGIGGNGSIDNGYAIPEIDIAVGRLIQFSKPENINFPKFKDPSKGMLPGTSLCKLGFPLHQIKPQFNTQTKSFELPEGSIPAPFFPLDGIFTREVNVDIGKPVPFPYMYIETSTPGLRGHSGGPTFDVHGVIWAIQSQTVSYPLGFGENQKGPESIHVKNQYLNVGWGVHAHSIVEFLRSKNISFELSSH